MPSFEIESTVTGTVWKINRAEGDVVEEGDPVVVLECMKMEVPVLAERAGTITAVTCEEGQAVSEYDVLMVLDPE